MTSNSYGIPVIPPSPAFSPEITRAVRIQMFRQALLFAMGAVDEGDLAAVEKLYLSSSNASAFYEGLKSRGVSPALNSIAWKWSLVLHCTANSLMLGYGRADQLREIRERFGESYSHFRVCMITRSCKASPHGGLASFIARTDDPIWQKLKAPFGWECGCLIDLVDSARLPQGFEPRQLGVDRLSQELLGACSNWMQRSPDHLFAPRDKSIQDGDDFPLPPTEPWRFGPTVEGQALLQALGISVKLVGD